MAVCVTLVPGVNLYTFLYFRKPVTSAQVRLWLGFAFPGQNLKICKCFPALFMFLESNNTVIDIEHMYYTLNIKITEFQIPLMASLMVTIGEISLLPIYTFGIVISTL